MFVKVCSRRCGDHMYFSPTNKSQLIWCAAPKSVEIKVSEREEKTPLAPLLPKPDGSEKDYVDSSCPEDIVIKEESVMDENSCNSVSLPSYCSESSSAEFLADSKVGILQHSQSGASLQSQAKSTSSQSSISLSNSFSVPQLNAPNSCNMVLQEFPSKCQSKLFSTDFTDTHADSVSMKENFCEKLEVNEETINKGKGGCGKNCGCDKCFAAAEVMKATSKRTYSGPIRRQIVKSVSGAKRTLIIVKKASLKNLQAKGLIQPMKYTGNRAHSLQSPSKNITQYVSVGKNYPPNNPLKGSQLGDSLPLKEAESCRKISSIQTQSNTDNCDGYFSSTESVDEPEVFSQATQTPNQDLQVPVKVSLEPTPISESEAPIAVPLSQTPNLNEHMQADVTMPSAQTPIPDSVNQDTQTPVTVSWAPVNNGSNSLSFTFTVKLPPGCSTPSGISHDSLQRATSLLNNTASQPSLQAGEDPNQRSNNHSLSNSGIASDQRIKGSKESVSSHSNTTEDSWQIDMPTESSKHLLSSPVMSTCNQNKIIDKISDSHSSESTRPKTHTSTPILMQKHHGHHPIPVTIPNLACEASSEKKKIHSNKSHEERREGNQPSKLRPQNRGNIQWIAVPSTSAHQSPPPSPGAPKSIDESNLTSDCQMSNTTNSSKQSSAHEVCSTSSSNQRVPRMHCPPIRRGASKELKRRYTCLLNKHRRRYYALLKKYKILEEKCTPHKEVGTPEQIIRDARKFLPEEHLLFLESQMFLRNRPGTGNRFSRKFMDLMVKYYKRSGAGYRYLRTIFTIPSVQTVQKYVAKSIDSLNEEVLADSREDCEVGRDSAFTSDKEKAENICQGSSLNDAPSKVSTQNVEYENSADHCDSEESSLEEMEVEEGEPKS